MLTRLRRGLTYANVMATIAVFLALGGASYAALKLGPNTVGSKNIIDGQVHRADIGKNAVDSSKVGDGKLLAKDFAKGQLPVSAANSNDPSPDVSLPAELTALSTSITTRSPSRIIATASANVKGDAGSDVYCFLQIGRGPNFRRISRGAYADFAGAGPNQDAALPIVGTAIEPAGTYTVRIECGHSAGNASYTAGNLAVIAVP